MAIFPLPVRTDPLTRARRQLAAALGSDGALAGLGRLARTAGLMGFTRDLGRIHERLVSRGLAVWLGEPFLPPGNAAADELSRVRDVVLRLLEQPAVAV